MSLLQHLTVTHNREANQTRELAVSGLVLVRVDHLAQGDEALVPLHVVQHGRLEAAAAREPIGLHELGTDVGVVLARDEELVAQAIGGLSANRHGVVHVILKDDGCAVCAHSGVGVLLDGGGAAVSEIDGDGGGGGVDGAVADSALAHGGSLSARGRTLCPPCCLVYYASAAWVSTTFFDNFFLHNFYTTPTQKKHKGFFVKPIDSVV